MAYCILLLGTIISKLFISSVHGIHIEFFKNPNFTNLILESNSILKCNNVSANVPTFHVQAIKTDTCLLVYNNFDCKSPFSKKILPGKSLEWKWDLKSFHICNDEDGGSSLNIDITRFYNHSKPTEFPQVIQSYKNILSCVKVPIHVQELAKWSINNHGNSLLAYFEPDCSEVQWEPMYINDGIWYESQNIYSYTRKNNYAGKLYKIQSFGPSPNSTYFTNGFLNKILREVRDKHSSDIKAVDSKFDMLEKKFEQYDKKLVNFQGSLEDSLEKHKEEIKDLITQINHD